MLIESFLGRCRSLLANGKPSQRAVLCFGNEAGDVDSIVSSLSFAYWLDRYGHKQQDQQEATETAIPVISFPRNEFRLRGDAKHLFKEAGFKFDDQGAPKELIFIDELTSSPLYKDHQGQWLVALTDHNRPSDLVSKLLPSMQVVGIVDHHQDQQLFREEARIRVIDESCGSASTLVAQLFLEETSLENFPKELMELLLGTILIDTRNFDESANRFNQVDVDIHKKLVEVFDPKMTREDQSKWYDRLMEGRFDVSDLTAADLLRLDFKLAALASGGHNGKRLGFASIMATCSDLLERTNNDAKALEKDMNAMMNQHGLHALICFTKAEKFGKQHKSKRKGLIIMTNPAETAFLQAIVNTLHTDKNGLPAALANNPLFELQQIPALGFELTISDKHQSYAADHVHFYHVRKDITRKTLMPTVIEALLLL